MFTAIQLSTLCFKAALVCQKVRKQPFYRYKYGLFFLFGRPTTTGLSFDVLDAQYTIAQCIPRVTIWANKLYSENNK